MDGGVTHYEQLYLLCCPWCGGKVVVGRLEVEDETSWETVFLFDCENGDFSASATGKTLNTIMAEIVVARLVRSL